MIKIYIISFFTLFLAFSAGSAKGVSDTLQFHYTSSVFVKMDAMYWNPSISWKNKYNDWDGGDTSQKFPFSKTALVALTDGWHLFQMIEVLSWCLCALTCSITMSIIAIGYQIEQLDRFWKILSEFSLVRFSLVIITALYVSYIGGFSVFYNWLLVGKIGVE